MIRLAEKIGLEESVITQLKVIYENKENIISALSDMCMNKGFHILKGNINISRAFRICHKLLCYFL